MFCFRAGRGRDCYYAAFCSESKMLNRNCLLLEVETMYFVKELTDSLTSLRLVNFIDVTLACEDANSKLNEVVAVADFGDEDRVGNRFGS